MNNSDDEMSCGLVVHQLDLLRNCGIGRFGVFLRRQCRNAHSI